MKNPLLIKKIAIAHISSIALIVSQSAIAPAAPAPQFTADQLQKLNSLNIKIAAPTYIPAGFRISNVHIEPGRGPGRPGYAIAYRGPNNTCFGFASGKGGLGGPSMDGYQTFPINSPLLGQSTLYYGRSTRDPKNAPPALFTLPIEAKDGRWYQFEGAGFGSRRDCENITPQEAIKVIQSVQYLG